LVLVGSLGLLPGDLGVTVALAAEGASAADRQMAEGLQAYQRGAFEDAAAGWTEAARLYEQTGKLSEQIEALIFLAQAYQSLGHYTKALQSLQSASTLIEKTGDRSRLARIKGLAGALYLASGQPEEASRSLSEGLQLAKEVGNNDLTAVILNDKGNLLASQKKHEEAIAAYTESISLAQATKNHTLVVRGLINAATASLESGRHQDARDRLDQALKQVRILEDSYDKAYSLITIGLAYKNLRPHLPETNGALMLQAFQSLDEAVKVAAAIENPRAISYAWGYLGSLYETERRYAEALDLTRRAVMAAQQAVAPEALYRWYWQTGRLFKALGKREDAIAAYRLAVPALQSIRPEMLLTSGAEPPYFRESVGPLFFELADLLLQQAASMEERARYEPYLREARDAIEQFKVAELRDYFRDECVDAARSRVKGLETVSPTAAVVYPILLPDRLELLVSLATGLQRVTVPVKAETLTKEIRAFRKKLEKRTTQEYLPYAQQLYGWLIRPIELVLASLPIDTLVFVPDGPLLTIPMAALHDGKQFLISRYAVAVTPGLTLTDPRPLKRSAVKALSVGLTESVRNFPPLPNVAEELEAIQRLYPGTLLLNKDFLVPRVEKELKEGLFTILHVASHGQFDTDVRKTFLLTFDDKLTMEKLSQYIGVLRFREEPLELLTLSACQTAAGDDRAALGLAGVAIKAGARSALATLWFINDQASSTLVSEFYRQLQDPSVSKAVALQRAQLKMLEEPAFDHPAYWAPFLLLNNWL
jgi:CHAT domain-containing protein/predicted negative regulator of RcsB-dependent stress response